MYKMKIREFVSNSAEALKWLELEKIELEKTDGFINHWFHSNGFGLVVSSATASGELHLTKDGTVSMHIENTNGDTLHEQNSKTNDLQVAINMYTRFKEIIISHGT